MPEMKIDCLNYDNGGVLGVVKALAKFFNIAAAIISDADDYFLEELKPGGRVAIIIEEGHSFFKEKTRNAPDKPITLSPADQDYLQVAFLEAASKMGKMSSSGFDPEKNAQELTSRADALFDYAVKKGIIQIRPPSRERPL